MRWASPPERVVDAWPSVQIAEADVGERGQEPANRFVVFEEGDGFVDAHREHIGDGAVAEFHGQRLAIETLRRGRRGRGLRKSGRKFISIRFTPWPSHSSQRPPLVLKLKRPMR